MLYNSKEFLIWNVSPEKLCVRAFVGSGHKNEQK